MVRALYTAASGMRVHQNEINNVGNNIANVGTVGYKKIHSSFKETLYDAMEIRNQEPNVNLQVGNGARVERNRTTFKQGILESTGNSLDIAISGEGFFVVQGMAGEQLYTRNGSFKLGRLNGGAFQLETREGNPVLSRSGQPIRFNGDISEDDILISEDGTIYISDKNGNTNYHAQLDIRTFVSPDGLQRAGGAYFLATEESGPAVQGEVGEVLQKYLEVSNVDLSEEMAQLIMSQRAYQLNSRVLQTADEMERLANNLRG